MRTPPDLREVAQPHFDSIKAMLVKSATEGELFPPVFAMMTLTPWAQVELEQPDTVMIVPRWESDLERVLCIKRLVDFANKHAECIIFCGSGRGICTKLGDGEVFYVFASVYLPGFEPWTIAQMYTIVEKEVIYAQEFSSSDNNIAFFQLPGLWPSGVAPA